MIKKIIKEKKINKEKKKILESIKRIRAILSPSILNDDKFKIKRKFIHIKSNEYCCMDLLHNTRDIDTNKKC